MSAGINVAEVFEVAGVGQRVKVYDLGLGSSSKTSRTNADPINPAPPVTKYLLTLSLTFLSAAAYGSAVCPHTLAANRYF